MSISFTLMYRRCDVFVSVYTKTGTFIQYSSYIPFNVDSKDYGIITIMLKIKSDQNSILSNLRLVFFKAALYT